MTPSDDASSRRAKREVVIVGGGPAGLNAALILGRCRRTVLLLDEGRPRNASSRGVNGFLTRDGAPPGELRRLAREQLQPYASVEFREAKVVAAECRGADGFVVSLPDGERIESRKLLLAPGILDELPAVAGVAELYGQGVYNCPYCDGFEHRDGSIAVYGKGTKGMNFALELTIWSTDLVLCTDGPAELSDEHRARLDRAGIRLVEAPLTRLEGDGKGLRRLHFQGGDSLEREALFFIHGEREGSDLVDMLGCTLNDKGTVQTHGYEKTNVPGLYVAGDASRRVHFAIVAAAEGAMAAFSINTELLKEDLAARGLGD